MEKMSSKEEEDLGEDSRRVGGLLSICLLWNIANIGGGFMVA